MAVVMASKKQANKRTGTRRQATAVGKPPRGPMGTIGWVVPGPFNSTDIPALVRSLKGLRCVADVDHTLLAEKMNQAIRAAVAFRDIERERPANHEVLDFLHYAEAEATALLRRFGLSDQFNPFPPTPLVPDHNADWFVHMRQGLALSKALPWWLFSGNIGGLRLGDHAARGIAHARHAPHLYGGEAPMPEDERRAAALAVAGELIHAAPIMLALLAEAARAKASALQNRNPRRGARPDLFRRMLFRDLTMVHRDMFGVLPRILDNNRERLGPSVTWIVRVLGCAAKRAEEQDYPGGVDLRELAKESDETLAKHLQTASTGIRRHAPQSSAGTEVVRIA
jgi:hypothetical protein